MSIGPQNRITDEVAEQLKAATELLEAVVRDRSLLAALSVEERTRLLSAAGDVFNPDLVAAAAVGQDDAAAAEGGEARARRDACSPRPGSACCARSRCSRRRTSSRRSEFEQADVDDDPEFREVVEPQHCYVCKRLYREIHPFYDQLCPACGDFNYAQADGDGRPARAASRCSPAGA